MLKIFVSCNKIVRHKYLSSKIPKKTSNRKEALTARQRSLITQNSLSALIKAFVPNKVMLIQAVKERRVI